MGVRDVVLGLMIAACIPAAVLRPFFGLLAYSWLAYMRAPDMTSIVPQCHPSLLVAIATIVGVLIHKDERLLVLEKRTVLLAFLFAAIGVSALLAPDPAASMRRGDVADLGKFVFIALLTTGLVRTPDRARLLLLTIAGSLGVLAVKSFLQGLEHPGVVVHGPGGAIGDANDYGVALVMALPLLAMLARDEESHVAKAVLVTMAVACVGGVLLVRSRGGALALAVLAAAWIASARRSRWTYVATAVFVALVVLAAPPELFARLHSIAAGDLDPAAQGRVVAWEKALHAAADRPIFGVGPGNLDTKEVWFRYDPVTSDGPFSAHNGYLQILAESGTVALTLYLLAIGATLRGLAKTRRDGPEAWRSSHAHAVMLSLVAFVAGSFFLSRAHFELAYQLVGVSVALRVARPGEEFDWFGLRRAAPVEGATHG